MKNWKKTMLFLLACTLVFSACLPLGVTAADNAKVNAIYVAPDGNDQNDGSIDHPFATLEAARAVVRKLKNGVGLPEGGIRVYLREGTYFRDKTLELIAEDSGTEGSPVIYTAYPGEKVVITGGATLNGGDFKKVTDTELLSRLPKAAQDKIYEIDLSAQGVEKLLDPKPSMQALFNDESLRLARWPNDDYYIVPKVIDEGTTTREYGEDKNPPNSPNYIPPEKQKNDPGIIQYDVNNINNWTNLEDVYLEGYWGVLWSTDILQITERDTEKKTLKFNRATTYGVKNSMARFYAFNVFEEIDAPGEYYIDKNTMKMYLYPPADMNNAKIELTELDKEFVLMKDVENVAFSNISFETNALGAIRMEGGKNNNIQGCSFSKIQDAVITINQAYDVGVASCNFKNIGGKGVAIDSGDKQTITPANIYVENCTFEKFQQIKRTYNPAIAPDGVGTRMSHNVMFDSPHTAILFNGMEMNIEYNEIFDMVKETDDAGAIYSGRDMTSRGNKITYNYIHDMDDGQGAHGRAAIYMDDAMSSMTAFGNIFNNIQKGFFMGGGRDHVIANNIFVRTSNPIPFDARQAGMTVKQLLDKETTDTIPLRFQSVPYDSPVWLEKYPEVNAMVEDENPGYPKGNSIYNNAFINSEAMSLHSLVTEYAKRLEGNEEVKLSGSGVEFSKDKRSVTLDPNGKLFEKIPGFEMIPTEKIGSYTNRLNDKLSKVVALKIASPNALVKGAHSFVDPDNLAVQPLVVDDRTLVPVRFITESFGADVTWDGATEEVGVKIGGSEVKLTLGSDVMTVNGAEQKLDVPAQTIEDRTMIPLRALVESINKKVFWDDRGLILISDEENVFDTEEDAYLIDDTIRRLSF